MDSLFTDEMYLVFYVVTMKLNSFVIMYLWVKKSVVNKG